MYCSNCGYNLSDSDNFCPKCGKKVQRIDNEATPSSHIPPTPNYIEEEEEPDTTDNIEEPVPDGNSTAKTVSSAVKAFIIVLCISLGVAFIINIIDEVSNETHTYSSNKYDTEEYRKLEKIEEGPIPPELGQLCYVKENTIWAISKEANEKITSISISGDSEAFAWMLAAGQVGVFEKNQRVYFDGFAGLGVVKIRKKGSPQTLYTNYEALNVLPWE